MCTVFDKFRRIWPVVIGVPGLLLATAVFLRPAPASALTGTYAPGGVPVHHAAADGSLFSPRSDTLRYVVKRGTVFIAALPDTLADQPVSAYAVLRAPAMSWLVDRSFFWRTRPEDTGSATLLFRVSFANAPDDTLAVRVDVE